MTLCVVKRYFYFYIIKMDKTAMGNSSSARMIWLVDFPIILTIGIIGNVITIIVLSRKHTRKTSTTVFLTGLAVAELTVLLQSLPRWWIIHMFGVDIRLLSNFYCKLHLFIGYTIAPLPGNILAAITIERLLSMWKPLVVKRLCTKTKAFVVILVIVILLMLTNCKQLTGVSLLPISVNADNSNTTSPESNTSLASFVLNTFNASVGIAEGVDSTNMKCVSTRDAAYAAFYITYFQYVSFTVIVFWPQTVLVFGSIIILRSLVHSRRLRRQMTCQSQSQSSNVASNNTTDNLNAQIMITLMLVNVVFMIGTTPVNLFLLTRPYWYDSDKGMTDLQEVIWAVFNMFFYTAYSTNFILYFLSGAGFRKDVMDLLRCKKQSNTGQLSFSRISTVSMSTMRDHS